MQQDKQYNIAAITSQLKTKFSQLALIPDELLPTGSEGFFYLLARRNNILTLSLYVSSQNMPQILSCLGQSVPLSLQEFLDHSQSFLLDLDSVTAQGPWRFYIKNGEYDAEWASSRFIQTDTQSDTTNRKLEGMGFYFDPQADQVTQYKYYWFDPDAHIEVRQRFNATGQFLNTQEVTVAGLAGATQTGLFGVDDVDFTDFMLKYQYQSELNQHYITVTKDTRNAYTEYTGQSFGCMPVEPNSILDPSELRAFVNPT
jgi:hypothetical protein